MRAIYYLLDGTVYIMPPVRTDGQLIDLAQGLGEKLFIFSGFTKRLGIRKYREVTEEQLREHYERQGN